jgi:hypothetical protein
VCDQLAAIARDEDDATKMGRAAAIIAMATWLLHGTTRHSVPPLLRGGEESDAWSLDTLL